MNELFCDIYIDKDTCNDTNDYNESDCDNGINDNNNYKNFQSVRKRLNLNLSSGQSRKCQVTLAILRLNLSKEFEHFTNCDRLNFSKATL